MFCFSSYRLEVVAAFSVMTAHCETYQIKDVADIGTMISMIKERIKRARHECGWSQAELARRMSVTQPSVAEWESGREALLGFLESLK